MKSTSSCSTIGASVACSASTSGTTSTTARIWGSTKIIYAFLIERLYLRSVPRVAPPSGQACLEEFGDDAIPRLARRLEDPSNFGTAKAFVMMGYNAEKPAASALRALPGRTSEESKRKKKLRKQRKPTQRRNRR